MLRAIHVIDGPALEHTPESYARETWPGRTATAIRRVDREIDLECCYPDPKLRSEESFMAEGVRFRVFPSAPERGGLHWSSDLMAYLRRAASEGAIVHVHGYPTRLFRAVTRLRAPIVAQDHGRNPENYRAKTLLHLPYQRARQWLDERPLRKVAQFYYLTPGERDRLLRHVPPRRVRPQTMGIDVERFHPGDRHAAREALGLPTDGRMLLFIGNDMHRKGADIAIGALSHLEDSVRLALVGKPAPEVRRLLEADVAKRGLQDRVRFLGHVETPLMPEAHRAADVLVAPSRWEGTIITVSIMEALATNVPVVASPAGARPDMLGGFGISESTLTPEAFARAIQEAWGKSSGASQDYAARTFGWDAIARSTVEDYRRIWAEWYGNA